MVLGDMRYQNGERWYFVELIVVVWCVVLMFGVSSYCVMRHGVVYRVLLCTGILHNAVVWCGVCWFCGCGWCNITGC